jgi:hypothetical protein
MNKTVREHLFPNVTPCTNGNCVVQEPKGMQTNGSCKCVIDMSRTELHILQARIASIINCEVICHPRNENE